MNAYEALSAVLYSVSLPDDILSGPAQILNEILEGYAALAPNWADAPKNALYCVTHANGLQYWIPNEKPYWQPGSTGWQSEWPQDFYREVELPPGVDWRLCIWRRPKTPLLPLYQTQEVVL